MTTRSSTWFAVACAAAVLILGGRAEGSDALAGCDAFRTPNGGGSLDFGGSQPPIPADFFGPGSDPFIGNVSLNGVPLGSYNGSNTGNADTIVERLTTAVLPAVGASDTVPIELVALSLRGDATITVTFNGGQNPTEFDLTVVESPTLESVGTITINHEGADGGTWSADFTAIVDVTFTEVGNPGSVFVMADVSETQVCLAEFPGEWSHADPGLIPDPCNPDPNFFVTVACIHQGPHPETVPAVAAIPAVSTWGMIVMTLLVLTGGAIVFLRRGAGSSAAM